MILWTGTADAKKVALILGNSNYAHATSLLNPANDSRILADAARRAGFEVTQAADMNLPTFQKTLRDFRMAADGADVAMIYYAGHGIEGQGKNWLIPVDAKLETDFDLPYEAIHLDRLLESLVGARVRMVVLDACRNNPFGSAWKSGVRAVPRGLGEMEIDDVLVIYAAAPGQTALDGTGINSPFAESLARRLPQPGLALQLLGGSVRDDVLAATGGKQRPFVSASITGTPVYLVQQQQMAAAQPVYSQQPAVVTGPAQTSRETLDALMWQGAVSSNSAGGYQAYLREFPNGMFAAMARENATRFQPTQSTVTPQQAQGGAQNVGLARSAEAQMPTVALAPPVQQQAPAPAPKRIEQPPVAVIAPPPAPVAMAPARAPEPVPADPAITGTDIDEMTSLSSAVRLPDLPMSPRFSMDGYPNCREEFQAILPTLARVDAINRCTVALDQYYEKSLTPFRRLMIEHQNRISRLYSEEVGGKLKYLAADQERFFNAMMKEHAESNPDGANFADHRTAEARYNADRAYMQDRYCANTGCNGYPVPPYVADPAAAKK